MCDTENNCTLPKNADKILFAEDFMNHMLLRFELPLLPSAIAVHRNFIHNAFDEDVRDAANCAFEKFEEEMAKEFEDILNSNTKDIKNFSNYATSLRDRTLELMLPDHNGAKALIKFCVKISTLAGKFYMSGFECAPRLAVDNIVSLIYNFDMLEEGRWEKLKAVAANYSELYMDRACNCLPSDTTDSNLSCSDSHTCDCDCFEPSSKDNSEDSRSPAPEMDLRVDENEQLKENDVKNV